METKHHLPTIKQIIAAAITYVYSDVDDLVQDAAKDHAMANMGHVLGDFINVSEWLSNHPEYVISFSWGNLMGLSENDESGNDERKGWLEQAKKDVAAVQKKKLPLTMENARLAFKCKGPFEKKTRIKK